MKDELRSQFRLSGEVGMWLKQFAKDNCRSMNGQLEAIVKEKMEAVRSKNGKTLIAAGKH